MLLLLRRLVTSLFPPGSSPFYTDDATNDKYYSDDATNDPYFTEDL